MNGRSSDLLQDPCLPNSWNQWQRCSGLYGVIQQPDCPGFSPGSLLIPGQKCPCGTIRTQTYELYTKYQNKCNFTPILLVCWKILLHLPPILVSEPVFTGEDEKGTRWESWADTAAVSSNKSTDTQKPLSVTDEKASVGEQARRPAKII